MRFPKPYTDNELLCSLNLQPNNRLIQQASNTTTIGLAVRCPTLQFHPKITPETISEGQKSGMLCML